MFFSRLFIMDEEEIILLYVITINLVDLEKKIYSNSTIDPNILIRMV